VESIGERPWRRRKADCWLDRWSVMGDGAVKGGKLEQ
jgi:hypothetical protein